MGALPPPFLRLPQHLIDTILEALFESGPASIKPFALVARSFRRCTQLHLFKQIDFGLEYPSRDYPYRPRARELNDIIKCNPTIADYIQELKVVLSDGDTKWITQDDNLQQVMKAVKNSSCPLQKLSIRGYCGLPISEVQVIETFFWRPYVAPNITTLDMRKIQNATPTLFSSCIMLRNLTLYDVKVTLDESKIEKPPSIQYLHYKFSGDAVRLLAGGTSSSASCGKIALDISCLQSLTLVTSIPADFSYAQAIIDAAADSLEQLSLECGAHYLAVVEPFPGTLSFARTRSLRHLEIESVFEWEKPSDEDPLEGLYQTMATIPDVNRIETMDLIIFNGRFEGSRPSTYFHTDWKSLDREITRISSGKTLSLSLLFIYFVGEEATKREIEVL